MFKKMDSDNDGIVSIEELKAGFQKFGSQLAESEVQMFIEAVSIINFHCSSNLLHPNSVVATCNWACSVASF